MRGSAWGVQRRGLTGIALLVVLTALGCGREEPHDAVRSGRLFDAVKQGGVPVGPLEERTVASWTFDDGCEGWHAVRDVEVQEGEGGRMILESTGTDPIVECPVDFPASEVDRIEIELQVPDRNSPSRLYWMREGDTEFAESRSVGFLVPRDGNLHLATIRVGVHPEWTGKIERLRLDATDVGGVRVEVDAIRASAAPAERRRLETVQIGQEWRSCRVSPAGEPWEVEVAVPPGAALDFGFAVDPSSWNKGVRLRFRVEVLPPGRKGSPHLEWEGEPDDRSFRNKRFDLGSLGITGERLRFRFEVVVAEGTPDPRRHLGLWANPVVLPPRDRPPLNLILVSLDTLRADHLSMFGYPRMTSPFLDRLAAGGALFLEASSQAPETLASHMSLLTGRLPGAVGVFDEYDQLPPESPTLARAFRERGYLTAAFTEGGFVSGTFGFHEGFDLYHDGTKGEIGEGDPRQIAGGDVRRTFARAADWLDRYGDQPFFLFLHTYEIHTPYSPPMEVRRFCDAGYTGPFANHFDFQPHAVAINTGAMQPTPEDLRQIIDLYDSEIAYVDEELRKFFGALASRGLLASTLVAVVSDHGEEFGERGGWAIHGNSLYGEEIHVPLILHGPGIPAGRVVEEPVSLVDVPPTIVEMFGLSGPAELDGVSLLELVAGGGASPAPPRDVWSEDGTHFRRFALRRGRQKLIVTEGIEGPLVERICRHAPGLGKIYFRFEPTETYDLFTDPGERHDLGKAPAPGHQNPELQQRLSSIRERCKRVLASREEGADGVGPGDVERSRLSALGYFPSTQEAGPVEWISAEEARRRCAEIQQKQGDR